MGILGAVIKTSAKVVGTVAIGGAGIIAGSIGMIDNNPFSGDFEGLSEGCFNTVKAIWDPHATKENNAKAVAEDYVKGTLNFKAEDLAMKLKKKDFEELGCESRYDIANEISCTLGHKGTEDDPFSESERIIILAGIAYGYETDVISFDTDILNLLEEDGYCMDDFM